MLLFLGGSVPLCALTVNGLRVQSTKNPDGIDVSVPKFSWILRSNERETMQTTYRLVVTSDAKGSRIVWDSGTVTSDQSVKVPAVGIKLLPSTRYYWTVTVTDNKGKKVKSKENAYFETGLMGSGWSGAQWIKDIDAPNDFTVVGKKLTEQERAIGENRLRNDTLRGVPMFRKAFSINKKVKQAKLYTAALGIYDLFMNGKRVGHLQADGTTRYEELKPGWSDYRKRVFYSSHDVTHLLAKGGNAIGAVVGRGWWGGFVSRGEYGYLEPLFIAKLLVTYSDGTTETVVTDRSWQVSRDGALRYSDVYNGERYDARKESAWTTAQYAADRWHAAETKSMPHLALDAFKGPYVEALERLKLPAKTTTVYQGATPAGNDFGMINVINKVNGASGISLKAGQKALIDFGQNFSGWVMLSVSGNEGTRLHLRFGEMTNDDGVKKRGNDGPGGSLYTANLRTARAEIYYTLRGTKGYETYHPSTTFFGFRYCEITATAPVTLVSVVGQAVTSSTVDAGTVTTSSNIINKLVSNIMWGQRSNLLSIPTDCPQRDERLGWTADTQIFSRTGMYNADTETFYRKWVTDMSDGQTEQGGYPDVAPVDWQFSGTNGAWSDAGIVVPWNLYLMYGNKDVLKEHFASMEHYMDYLATQTGDGYKYQGAGTAYGDWLSFAPTDSRYISVAYYAYDAELMAKMARVLSTSAGDEYDRKAKKYQQVFENIKAEFQKRYFAQAVPNQQSQTAYLLALKFNLCKNSAQQQDIIQRLRKLITDNNETLSTGFVGTGIVNPTLSEFGMTDKAYNLLLQRNCPSWLYSIDQGATTVWERWNSYTVDKGYGDIGMNSFNHYAYGAVGEWLYRFVAGIETDEQNPGFKHIVLQPTPDTRTILPNGQERITSAKASYASHYGDIVSEWSTQNSAASMYNVTVPANTTATLYLLAPDKNRILEGNVEAGSAEGVTFIGYDKGRAVYNLGSGSYRFSVLNR